MAHEFEVLSSSEIIRVTYSGDLTLDERIQVVHKLCCDFNIFSRFKLLIDVRNVQQEMTELEQEIFGKFIASKEEFDTALVAVLDKIEAPVDEITINEASKDNYQIKMFNCEKTALSWLKI